MPEAASSRMHLLPWPQRQTRQIYPLFLPWLGCRSRCIFCAQDVQTGKSAPANEAELLARLEICETDLKLAAAKGRPQAELAFYGGTFTALPEHLWRICLDFALRLQVAGLISGFRCSTRPDCIDSRRLGEMKECGCQLIELGIQSFDSATLSLAGRGYSAETALRACRSVAAAALGPGIQLMPGLPGNRPDDFLEDVKTALACKPACLRFYPCLVLAGSALAGLWRKGRFAVWNLQETVRALSTGWLLAGERQVPVIRMGLAAQAGLSDAILAGPRHPSLGSMVMSQALLQTIQKALQGKPPQLPWQVSLPEKTQGYRTGWRGELLPFWQGQGPCKVEYWKRNEILVIWRG